MNQAFEILNVTHRAEMTFDDGDFDAHLALWTEEVRFESPFGNAGDAATYRQFIEGFYKKVSSVGGTRHFVINPVITLEGDNAVVDAYLHVINRRDGSFMGSSVIHDELRRVAGTWKLTMRRVMPDQALPV